MHPREQIYMRLTVSTGDAKVFWMPGDGTAREVILVAPHKDEDCLCAYFQGGQYVALDGCELNDFAEVNRLTLKQ